MKEGKSFQITQNEVLSAYKAVKANKGAGGVDRVDFEMFEKNWKNRLYTLWNRMASGTYFPKPVRGVEIPKRNGKVRLLGIPTIEDRVAQMVLRNRLEPYIEPIFYEDSYGYRPNKSALDAVGMARERCYKMKWVIEFDIVGLFDNINHEYLMKFVKHHSKEKWVNLYIERCLKAPIVMLDGTVEEREKGTPQGGVISPLLSGLYMHYAFDRWITREFPMCKWERYADDGVIHCVSKKQAEYVLDMLKKRMRMCGLEIHPEKSKIVYCQRNNEKIDGEITSFTFLGYCFRPRLTKSRNGQYFMGFTPAVSAESATVFREKIRREIQNSNTTDIVALSKRLNPIIRGWYNYFGKYCPSEAFRKGINYVNLKLVRWLEGTRKSVRRSLTKAQHLLHRIAMYLTQITEDGDLAVLSGSNQYHVSDKVIRGGVKIQKRDLETSDTKGQGSATLKDAEFEIVSLNDNTVLVEGKLYKKGEVVKTILTDIEGVASTSADLLPYGKYRIEESKAPEGYLTDGAKPIEFEITEDGKIVDLTGEDTSIYNQVKRGDLEGVKIGAGTHQRLAGVPFRITSKTTGESHVIVTDDNGQFSTSSDWASHKNNTNAGKTSEDGIWFGISEPDDSKGALIYDTYIIEELRCESNKGFELIPPFEIVVSRNNVTVDLGTLTDEYEKEITIHTTATGKDGEKSIVAGKEVIVRIYINPQQLLYFFV